MDRFYLETYVSEGRTADRVVDLDELLEADRAADTRMAALGLAETESRLLVLGGPGSGKTTLMKAAFRQALTVEPVAHLPLFVKLRDYRSADGGVRSLLRQSLAPCRLPDEEAFLDTSLAEGRLWLLLDGLDEVATSEIDDLTRELAALFDLSPDSRFVVTSRFGAMSLWLEGFTEVEMSPLSTDQVGHFVALWFEDDGEKARQCLRLLFSAPEMEELASTPLFLTLICLAYQRTLSVPPTRTQAYADSLTALLERWDAKRGIARENPFRYMTIDLKRQLLSRVAAKGFDHGQRVWRQDDLEHEISAFLDEATPETVSAANVLEGLQVHHGVMQEVASRYWAFSHQGFQEYFAAFHAAQYRDGRVRETLLGHLMDEGWSEVLVIFSAMLPDGQEWMEELTDTVLGSLHELQLQGKAADARRALAVRTWTTPVDPEADRHLSGRATAHGPRPSARCRPERVAGLRAQRGGVGHGVGSGGGAGALLHRGGDARRSDRSPRRCGCGGVGRLLREPSAGARQVHDGGRGLDDRK